MRRYTIAPPHAPGSAMPVATSAEANDTSTVPKPAGVSDSDVAPRPTA